MPTITNGNRFVFEGRVRPNFGSSESMLMALLFWGSGNCAAPRRRVRYKAQSEWSASGASQDIGIWRGEPKLSLPGI
jgi:hypothetical protein